MNKKKSITFATGKIINLEQNPYYINVCKTHLNGFA